MKKKSVILLISLFFSTFVFSQNEDPVVLSAEQFAVKDENGNSFYLKMPVKEVFDILGEPKKKTNLWGIYPQASCAYYQIEYDGILFKYFDVDDYISTIWVNSPEYSISNLTINSSLELIEKTFEKLNSYQHEYNNIRLQKRHKFYIFNTLGTNLSYMEHTVNYYYVVGFDFPVDSEVCDFFYVEIPFGED